MNKCFITKLPSSVDNDNLPVLGQLRINWLKNALSSNSQRVLRLNTNDNITVKVSGAHFTDNTLTSNLGNTKTITAVADGNVALYVSNDADAILTIDNKYALKVLRNSDSIENWSPSSISFDIDDIRYCTNFTSLLLQYTRVTGDISAVSKLTNLKALNLAYTQVNGDIKAISGLTKLCYLLFTDDEVSGDISVLSNFTNLIMLKLGGTSVSGDISGISKLTNLTDLELNDTNISGDISAVSKLTNLTDLRLHGTNISGDISAIRGLTNLTNLLLVGTKVSGDISAISGLTNLTSINLNDLPLSGTVDSFANLTRLTDLTWIQGSSLTGDMSKIPANVKVISMKNRKIDTNFTWTAKGRQNATLLAMEGNIPFDTTSMDNMFIDQATCTFRPNDSQSWTKFIAVKGTRTSASDAAVAAIQNMGVTITGVIKQA